MAFPLFTRNVRNTDPSILPALYKKHLASYPQVRDLDVLCRSSVMWSQNMEDGCFRFKDMGKEISEAMTPQSLDRRLWILDKAIDIAKLSENGKATIVTLPPLTVDALNHIKIMPKGAQIRFDEDLKIIFQNDSIKKAKTVVLTDAVIKGSRNKGLEAQRALLKSKGFDGNLPDTLPVLAATFFTQFYTFRREGENRIYRESHRHLNSREVEVVSGATRTQQGMDGRRIMTVQSFPFWILVCSYIATEQDGVGVSVGFDVLPPLEDISS